ncbi:hypothetical protein SAMN05920897_13511, partial [Alkalispirochaeta americana]
MSLRTSVGAALSRIFALDCRLAVALADNFSYYSLADNFSYYSSQNAQMLPVVAAEHPGNYISLGGDRVLADGT